MQVVNKMDNFKVWCEEHGEWEKDEVMISSAGQMMHVIGGRFIPLRTETHKLCWSACRFDINGTEMYSGDIIEVRSLHDSNAFDMVWNNEKQMSIPQVIISKSNPHRIIMPSDSDENPAYWEIVGNVHETPELLE